MRYAIQNSNGAFYTECAIVGTKDSIEVDGSNAKFVHQRHVLAPQFTAFDPKQASRFSTEPDATEMLSNPFLADPGAFTGCKVVPVDA